MVSKMLAQLQTMKGARKAEDVYIQLMCTDITTFVCHFDLIAYFVVLSLDGTKAFPNSFNSQFQDHTVVAAKASLEV